MTGRDIMTLREDYLKVKDRTIDRLAVNAEIPGFKVSGSLRFEYNEID